MLGHLDVPFDATRVLGRRAEGVAGVHVTAAAEEMLTAAAETVGIICREEIMLIVLARIWERATATPGLGGSVPPA